MSAVASKLVTADELYAMGDIGRCELVRGEIVRMAPAGDLHGRVTGELTVLLGGFIRQHRLGVYWAAESGFIVSQGPDTVRAPDFAFVTKDRATAVRPGYCSVAPDLVVEVVSPHDSAGDVAEKVSEWLAFGVRSVWVAEPKSRTITIHHQGTSTYRYGPGDTLTDEAVLPGFALRVAEVFSQ